MPVNIQNQTAQYIYNAETIHFGQAQNQDDFRDELKKLQDELNKAIDAKALTEDKAIDAEMHMKKAMHQAKEEKPDKASLIDHISQLKEIVVSVEGLATVCAGAITAIGVLF